MKNDRIPDITSKATNPVASPPINAPSPRCELPLELSVGEAMAAAELLSAVVVEDNVGAAEEILWELIRDVIFAADFVTVTPALVVALVGAVVMEVVIHEVNRENVDGIFICLRVIQYHGFNEVLLIPSLSSYFYTIILVAKSVAVAFEVEAAVSLSSRTVSVWETKERSVMKLVSNTQTGSRDERE
ncbi:hypothetical protein MW887_002683 [Aspergillus wentii]|nr:hypothetical protein MW887_002683 [Aspergillus wentii]